MNFKKVTIITGHYGSGKTNLSVNLVMDLKKQGKSCSIVDLDIVNPYFRSADFKSLFSDNEIPLIVSKYANSNLDIPSLSFDLRSVIFKENEYVIIDVGGDDAGASALGRYKDELMRLNDKGDLDMLYVVNSYRYLTRKSDEALSLLRDIEYTSGLKATGIVNNSNLGTETTAEIIKSSISYADELSHDSGLPLLYSTGKKEYISENIPCFYPIDIYVKTIW